MTEKLKTNTFMLIILSLYWLLCIAVSPILPEQLPIHWNLSGAIDGYSHKFWAALIMPLWPLGLYLLMGVFPLIGKDKYILFAASYEIIRTAISLIMVPITAMPILVGLGYDINVDLTIRILLPLLFIIIGSHMGRLGVNYFIGIRTPWTLANSQVWNKTHQLGGKLVIAGALLALTGVFLDPFAGFIVLMVGILFPFFLASLYSYILFRTLK